MSKEGRGKIVISFKKHTSKESVKELIESLGLSIVGDYLSRRVLISVPVGMEKYWIDKFKLMSRVDVVEEVIHHNLID